MFDTNTNEIIDNIETAINIFNNEIGKIFQNILVERCFEVKNDFLSNVNLL